MMEMSSCLESPLPRVPPARPVACDHPAMEVKGASAVSFDSRSGVAPHDSDTFRLPLSSSSSELSARWSFLLLFAPLLFANRDMARATCPSVPAGQSSGVGPQRSCSVGAAKLVSHVCDSACSAVRRREGSGWRRARMKFLAVGAKVR